MVDMVDICWYIFISYPLHIPLKWGALEQWLSSWGQDRWVSVAITGRYCPTEAMASIRWLDGILMDWISCSFNYHLNIHIIHSDSWPTKRIEALLFLWDVCVFRSNYILSAMTISGELRYLSQPMWFSIYIDRWLVATPHACDLWNLSCVMFINFMYKYYHLVHKHSFMYKYYPVVHKHSYGKRPYILRFPNKNGDLP